MSRALKLPTSSYVVTVRNGDGVTLYRKVRRGAANALLREAQRRFPDWDSVDVAVAADVLHVHETRPREAR